MVWECQLKILRYGDLVAVGRSLMLVGSESEIASRLAALEDEGPTVSREMSASESSIVVEISEEAHSPIPVDIIQINENPSIPDGLSPGQKAQLCEILDHLQSRLHRLIESARTDENNQEVVLKTGRVATSARLPISLSRNDSTNRRSRLAQLVTQPAR